MLLAAFGSANAIADADSVTILLTQSRAALGGPAITHAGVLKTVANISVGGLSGTQTSWKEIGGTRFARTSIAPPFTQSDGFDGTVVWNEDSSGLVWVDGGAIGRAREIAEVFVGDCALWLPDHGGARITWGGTKTTAGVSYDVLAVTPPGADAPFELWFDGATHLPSQLTQTFGTSTAAILFSDYHQIRGLMVPFREHSVDLEGNVTDTTVETIIAGDTAQLEKPRSSNHDFSISGGRMLTSVAMNLVDNHAYVPVMLNGKGPFRFILDSGGENVVDPAVAAEIGAAGHGTIQGGGSGANTQSASFANVDTLEIGDATVTHQLFAIAPIRKGFGISAGQPVDGLIGFEVLARFVTTFDYANRRIVLSLPGARGPPAGAAEIPLVLDDRQPQFACRIDAIDAQCTLDTGARDSMALYGPFTAAHPKIVAAAVSAVGVNGFGFGGASYGRLGRLQSFQMGPFALGDIIANFSSDEAGSMSLPFVGANIGGNIWRRFALNLDYGRQTIELVPNASYAAPDVYERAGMFLIDRDGKYQVLDARPDTPAARAGIVKGDIVVSIDGASAATMSLDALRARFLAPAGTKISLGVQSKEGMPRMVTIVLRDIV